MRHTVAEALRNRSPYETACRMKYLCLLLLFGLAARPGVAQDPVDDPTGFTVVGLPVFNYDSDEGLGYGARLALYNHGQGGYTPYRYTLEADVFFTTEGRRTAALFFDAPHLPGSAQRLTAEVQYERFDPAPYYGLGNDAAYNEALTDPQSPAFVHADFYGFRRTRFTAWASYQHRVGPFKLLGGLGLAHTRIDLYVGTLLRADGVDGKAGGFTNTVKAGLIYDTRDFEPAPSRGDWTDLILEASHKLLGSDYDYARLTLTNRHYVTLAHRLVLAERIVFERSWGALPFYELTFFGSSFKVEEGLGGSESLRGHLRNRFAGPMKLFGTLELRWRLWDMTLLRQDLYLALSAFLDYGRVWRSGEAFTLRGFHTGQGGGVHVGWNETFIVTANIARSNEVARALYLNVGYLF